jgi:hypothetical protein
MTETVLPPFEVTRALPAEAREHDVLNEDVARLSPLKHANLNVLGHYSFRASAPAGGGVAVRGASPLREELVRPQRTTKRQRQGGYPLLATPKV